MKKQITKAYTESKRNFFTDIAKLIIFVTIICCSNCSRESTKNTQIKIQQCLKVNQLKVPSTKKE